jgi:hypothetical protein
LNQKKCGCQAHHQAKPKKRIFVKKLSHGIGV